MPCLCGHSRSHGELYSLCEREEMAPNNGEYWRNLFHERKDVPKIV